MCRMIYSSITPYVHMLYTAEHDSEHICLDFTGRSSGRGEQSYGYDSFGVSSTLRFPHYACRKDHSAHVRSGVFGSLPMAKRS